MNMFIFQIRIYCNNYSRLLQCQRHTNPDYKGSSLLIKHVTDPPPCSTLIHIPTLFEKLDIKKV